MRPSPVLSFAHLLHSQAKLTSHLTRNPRWTASLGYPSSNARLAASMKRKAPDSKSASKAKRQKEPKADYCDLETRKDENGETIWPAPAEVMDVARNFLKEW